MTSPKHRGAYRTPSTKEKDMKLISGAEFRARDVANCGWTIVAAITFIATTISAAVQCTTDILTPAVLAVGLMLFCVFALIKKREHGAIIKQYWAQPNPIEKNQ